MSKITVATCDRCGVSFPDGSPKDGVTYVEVLFGGSGAARSSRNGIDLCRDCYGNLVSAIDGALKPLDKK